MLVTVYIVLALASTAINGLNVDDCLKDSQLLPGLNKMSLGIDIAELNLFVEKDQESGSKSQIFRFTCKENTTKEINNKKYLVPDQFGGVIDVRNKHFVNETTLNNNLESIMHSENQGVFQSKILSSLGSVVQKAGPKGKLIGSAISAANIFIPPRPGSVKKFQQLTVSRIATSFTTMDVNLYEVEFQNIKHLVFHDYFLEALNTLEGNFENNTKPYLDFIESYGTHFIRKIQMGGKIIERTQYSLDSLSSYNSKEVKQIANLYGPQYNNKDVNKLSKSDVKEGSQLDVYGGESELVQFPITSQKIKSWEASLKSNPWPISVHLSLITDVISNKTISQELARASVYHINLNSIQRFKQMLDFIRPVGLEANYYQKTLPKGPVLATEWIKMDQQLRECDTTQKVMQFSASVFQKQISQYIIRKKNVDYEPSWTTVFNQFNKVMEVLSCIKNVYQACSEYYKHLPEYHQFRDIYWGYETLWTQTKHMKTKLSTSTELLTEEAASQVPKMNEIIKNHVLFKWQVKDCHHLSLFGRRTPCNSCKKKKLEYYCWGPYYQAARYMSNVD